MQDDDCACVPSPISFVYFWVELPTGNARRLCIDMVNKEMIDFCRAQKLML